MFVALSVRSGMTFIEDRRQVVVAAGLSSWTAIQTTITAFDALMHIRALQHVTSIRSSALGRIPDNEEALINKSIARELQGFEALQRAFNAMRRRSRALRAADDAFRDYQAELDKYADFHRKVSAATISTTPAQLAAQAIMLGNAKRHSDVYWDDFRSLIAASQRVDGLERKE